MKRPLQLVLVCLLGFALTQLASSHDGESGKQSKAPDAAAVKRARKTVQMLDDIYKSAVVLITSKYVKDENDYPAGRAAIQWFKTITEKGWHTVRLIDVSGKPYDAKNVAQDPFEKEGVRLLKSGKDYYETIETKDGRNYLRAITAIPVVMQKCTLCHPNYKDAKKGEAVGALTYSIPID